MKPGVHGGTALSFSGAATPRPLEPADRKTRRLDDAFDHRQG
jgi:hypothetical protein